MRCLVCNKSLNDYEATLRNLTTLEFTDMCSKCLTGLGIETAGRVDLNPYDETPSEEHWDEYDDYDPQDYNEWEDEQ